MAETTPITQRLRDFLDGLIVLKEDRTTYIRSANVLVNYDTLCELHGAVESQFGALDSGNEKSSEQLDGTSSSLLNLMALIKPFPFGHH